MLIRINGFHQAPAPRILAAQHENRVFAIITGHRSLISLVHRD